MVSKAIPPQYNVSQPAVASYDWTDIANGSGNSVFYLLKSKNSAGDDYSLVTTNLVAGIGGASAVGWASTSYVSFDSTPFNSPRTMKGIAYFTGQFNYISDAGSVTATLCHYDGTTETTIGAETVNDTVNLDYTFCLSFDVTDKNFKKGDILRVKVKTSREDIYISVDPSGTQPGSILPAKIVAPFKIEL